MVADQNDGRDEEINLRAKSPLNMLAQNPPKQFPNNFEVPSKLYKGGTQNFFSVCLDLFSGRKGLDWTGRAIV